MNTYLTDLLKAQREIEGVDKDGKNPFFNSDYTTLNATIFACKKILNENNFIVLQPMDSDENGVYVCTTLIHISGEKITSKMRINQAKSNDPQAQGSAITYARRYSLKSILTMTDADDDAEKAMVRTEKRVVVKTTPEDDVMDRAINNGLKCKKCGAELVKNPKTGSWFCKDKCWLKE